MKSGTKVRTKQRYTDRVGKVVDTPCRAPEPDMVCVQWPDKSWGFYHLEQLIEAKGD